VPVGGWLRGAYRWLVDEYLLGDRAASRGLFEPEVVRRLAAAHHAGENHSERLWSLINLEIWHRIFLDGEDVDHVIAAEASSLRRGDVAPLRHARVGSA
jgi:asparagine synthase (glutamine-hydrolysing)